MALTELERREIYSRTMEKFHAGELRHGSTNEIVTDPRVAKAIATRKARMTKSQVKRRRL